MFLEMNGKNRNELEAERWLQYKAFVVDTTAQGTDVTLEMTR